MKHFRVPLSALMGLVLLCAIGFTALRSGSELWFRTLYTLSVALLLGATLAAGCARRRSQPFWFGFAVVGWGLLLVGLGVKPVLSFSSDEEWLDPLVNQYLLSTKALQRIHDTVVAREDLRRIGKYDNRVAIGHVLLTLTCAVGGGLLAVAARNARRMRVRRRATGGPESRVASNRSRRKTAAWAAGTAAVLIGLVAAPFMSPGQQGPYFPDLTLDSDKEGHNSRVAWYSKQLRAMGEPSLWTLSQTVPQVEVYRFLWLPSFHRPVCVRIEKSGSGATLHAVVLDGAGGSAPGSIAVSKSVSLTPAQWDEIARHVETANYWTLPSFDNDNLGSDGDQLIVEGVRKGRYHVVDRWSLESGPYYELCRTMLDLSGLIYKDSWSGYHHDARKSDGQ